MANSNFHVSFFWFSRVSKMKKIVPPPLHQNHFSSTSVKTRRKFRIPLRLKFHHTVFSNVGHHVLVFLILSCFVKTFMLTLAIENTQGVDLHPLIILAETQDQGINYQNILKELPSEHLTSTSSSAKTKREGRQYNYDNQDNQQRTSSNSRQESPQDLVSGNHFCRFISDIEFYCIDIKRCLFN